MELLKLIKRCSQATTPWCEKNWGNKHTKSPLSPSSNLPPVPSIDRIQLEVQGQGTFLQSSIWIILSGCRVGCRRVSMDLEKYMKILQPTKFLWPKFHEIRGVVWHREGSLHYYSDSQLCQLKIGTCPLPLQELSHKLLQPLTLNTPRKDFRIEIGNEALCALGKTSRTGLQIDIFRKRFHKPNSCFSSYLEKH